MQHGAHINTNEKVLSWHAEGDSIALKTNKGTYSCKKLVISTGSWLDMGASESDQDKSVLSLLPV